ncbi:hypothetical protein G7Y89_g642 [Cudoniella acicularis]|uniref:Uncharacterized protein n=1 Tax=Cudoniella acicularis TaxID=354080 RepID=A0A8H4RYQ7_9HELO|nr:hypothetical protein G7Y89_g642 [Cudoniella acicularis]
MSRRALRPRKDICQLCDFARARQPFSQPPIRTSKCASTSRLFSSSTRYAYPQKSQKVTNASTVAGKGPLPQVPAERPRSETRQRTQGDLESVFQEVKAMCDGLLSRNGIPSEQETVQTLTQCQALADLVMHESSLPALEGKDRASSALLSLDDPATAKTPFSNSRQSQRRMQDELSKCAYDIMIHPLIFITPGTLDVYVKIQSILKKPQTLPEIFHLYANKPLPEEGSSPIRYLEQNSNKAANAIPKNVADRALQTAIDAKQLVIAMDIVEFSYSTTAFRRAKLVKKALLPATGIAVAPLAAYTLASQLALLQTTMETGMATNVAFAGMLAYVGFTATIGVVAVTTANDQMDRVTWAPGLPLRERWIREEERAAIDKIAGAWGFKEVWRRGEEEGEEWDALREWMGLKGMLLDRSELMEGME